MKKVLFRSDANPEIGAGHLMRSVALAQAFCERGSQVRFMTIPAFEDLNRYLLSQPFDVTSLNLSPGQAGSESDLQFTMEEARKGYDWIVLDGYDFSPEFQKTLQTAGCSLVSIDDRPGIPSVADVSVKIDQPQYALIRAELRQLPKSHTKDIRNILVTLGGSRQTDTLVKIVRALKTLDPIQFHIKVLSGFDRETFFETGGPHRLEFLPATIDNYKLYAWADLAIAAGGGTAWELNYFKIPAVIGAMSERQAVFGELLSRAGACEYVGWYREASEGSIADAVKTFIAGRKIAGLVDGRGSERVLEAVRAFEREKLKVEGRKNG